MKWHSWKSGEKTKSALKNSLFGASNLFFSSRAFQRFFLHKNCTYVQNSIMFVAKKIQFFWFFTSFSILRFTRVHLSSSVQTPCPSKMIFLCIGAYQGRWCHGVAWDICWSWRCVVDSSRMKSCDPRNGLVIMAVLWNSGNTITSAMLAYLGTEDKEGEPGLLTGQSKEEMVGRSKQRRKPWEASFLHG